MRHRIAGRKLGRTSAHRLALMRNLSTSLFDKEKITTTLAKAKELRRFAEKLVTLSKKESLHARRQVLRQIQDRRIVTKLFDTLSARYTHRPGGYTRIIKLGPRLGDNAEMAVIELVGSESAGGESADKPETGKSKKAAPKKAKGVASTPKKKNTKRPAPSKVKTASKPATRKKAANKAGKKVGSQKKG